MERVTHGDDADEDDLYSDPPPDNATEETLRPTEQPLHDRATPPSPPLSTAARSSASYTATTARSVASTALSTLATSSHASNMSHADSKDAAVFRARQAQHARPTITLLNLVSDTATSSALPQPFGFSISRKGRIIAVFSTKNIWLVQADKLPRTFMRTLEVRRKPIAVEVLDDGSLLAVLSNPHKVDLYRLQDGDTHGLEKTKSVILSVDATTIALSPDGMVLATGYQYGIELVSLAEKASEHDRRSVNCDLMDHLAFSDDGRTLLATTSARLPRATTVFSVHGAFDGPFTEDGELIPQECHVAWTRQILFPEKAVTAKQALLLPDTLTGQVNELFAFDAEEDSWGIYDLAGVQFVETKEPPQEVGRYMRAESLEDALPTVSPGADHVAVAVKQQDSNSIWLYRLPDGYESNAAVYSDLRQHSEHHTPVAPCACISVLRPEDTSSQDISAMRWVSGHSQENTERLVAVGNVVWNTTPDTPIMPGESAKTTGMLIMMDFDFSQSSDPPGHPDRTEKIEIDLDETLPGEKLPEDDIDFEREVELVRTRTVAQRRGEAARAAARNNSLLRSSATNSPVSATRNPRVPSPLSAQVRGEDESQVAFEEPYSHGQPRSQMSLNRAATVAAAAPANRRHLRALPGQPLEYRRADGLREIPHESDADNWVPPPPPYTESADPPGPGAMSISLSHPMGVPSLPPIPQSPPAQHTSLPRLRIPTITQSAVADTFNRSAPPERPDSGSSSAFVPRTNTDPHSAHPVSQPNSSSRYSHPSSRSTRPLVSRHHTSPTRPSTSPPPTQAYFQFTPAPSSSNHSHPRSRRNVEPSAYQANTHLLQPQPQQQQHNGTEDLPSPSTDQLAALRRRDSVPTPVPPHSTLGSLGLNARAAQSADDLRGTRSNRPGRRSVRDRANVSRLATIRSTNSGSSAGRRASSAPNLAGINAREREKDGRDRDRVREGMRKLRCVVM